MFADFDWVNATTSSPIFLALVVCSIVTLAVAAERFVYFFERRGNPDDTLAKALKKINAGSPREAAVVCENTSHPLGAVAGEIFKNVSSRFESLEERMQIALSGQKLLLERNLNVLGTMAAIAPLIGLLGTVWGIMRAFHDMSQTGSAAPSVVASGVAEALVTTAAGLVVAVPALMVYNYFSRRMNVMLTVSENYCRSLRTALLDSGSPGVPGSGTASAQTRGGSRRHGFGQEPEPVATR
ncbi:MAG: MotA/TolQ/ExbB proton channel family protein [Candidatus Krumholzibacteriia bacterium]